MCRQDPEAIERYYREKYANTDISGGRFGEGEQMSDEIRQQSKLPGVKYAYFCACIGFRLFLKHCYLYYIGIQICGS